MSLYGSGRAEGIGAVAVLAFATVAVHVLAAVAVGTAAQQQAQLAWSTMLPAVGGALFYRFLRAGRHSRYAAFLGGLAYGLSPWFTALVALRAEAIAAALAPLALEVAARCHRPDQRRRTMPWAGICLSLPFVAGWTTVGIVTLLLAGMRLLHSVHEVDAEERRAHLGDVVVAFVAAAIATTSWIYAAPLAACLPQEPPPTAIELLAAHRAPGAGFDLAAFLRLPGAAPLLFALLAVLRRQRHTSNCGWLLLLTASAAPLAIALLHPGFPYLRSTLPLAFAAPVGGLWLAVVAVLVLGAAGLDDFLENPVRRRHSLVGLAVAVSLLGGAVLLLSPSPVVEWPFVAVLLSIAMLLPVWHRVGILRLKNILATVAAIGIAIPSVQILLLDTGRAPVFAPAAPLGETLAIANAMAAAAPLWAYSGVAAALLVACITSGMPSRRTKKASTAPAAARRAIAR